MEAPIHISNVCLCDKEGKKLKIKMQQNKDGEKELVYKKANKNTVYRTVKKVKHV